MEDLICLLATVRTLQQTTYSLKVQDNLKEQYVMQHMGGGTLRLWTVLDVDETSRK